MSYWQVAFWVTEMSDKLENLWANLSLTEEELTNVVVAEDWLDEVKKVGENCSVRHLVLNKRVNLEAMKNVLRMV